MKLYSMSQFFIKRRPPEKAKIARKIHRYVQRKSCGFAYVMILTDADGLDAFNNGYMTLIKNTSHDSAIQLLERWAEILKHEKGAAQ